MNKKEKKEMNNKKKEIAITVEETNKSNVRKNKRIKEMFIKILILILLVLLIGITSFRTGSKYYLLKNMYINDASPASVESGVARWYFNAKVINIIKYERR